MERFKFLLATDYSEAVMNAERYAIKIAEETGSSLTILHIYRMPVEYPSQSVEYARVKSSEEVYQSELKHLQEHRDELFRSLKIKPEKVFCKISIREGISIGKQIRKEAEDCEVDFIVVGTHGTGNLREAFVGSHSWDVMRKSCVPVFAVPSDAMFTGIKNIVFGTAYREEEEFPILDFLIHLAQQFNASVTILHVTNYVLTKGFETGLFEEFKHRVKDKFLYSKLDVRLLVNDDVIEGLNSYCGEHQTDLLVMSVPKMSLFEKVFIPNLSMTRKMSFHSHLPLLALPSSFNVNYTKKIFRLSSNEMNEPK